MRDWVHAAILSHLETAAAGFGYHAIRLETRLVNTRAVAFYQRQGYCRIPSYGKYVGGPEAATAISPVVLGKSGLDSYQQMRSG